MKRSICAEQSFRDAAKACALGVRVNALTLCADDARSRRCHRPEAARASLIAGVGQGSRLTPPARPHDAMTACRGGGKHTP